MAYISDEEKDKMRKEILDELNGKKEMKVEETPFVSYGMKKKVVNFDKQDELSNDEIIEESGDPSSKGTNKILLLICGILAIIGIYFFPKITSKIDQMKLEKAKKEAEKTKVEKKEEEKTIEKLKLTDSKVKNLIYPIYHIDSSEKATYYSKDKMEINNFSNYDLQVNAMSNFSNILYVNYSGGYSGKSCATNKISVDGKYFPIQVNNLYTKNVGVKQEDITIPTNNPANLYPGLWKYDTSSSVYVYYGDCSPKNTNTLYYDVRSIYDVDNSDKNIELYTYNYVAFATVDKNTKAYVLYSDVDYTKEISRGTLTSNDYSTELNNILSKLPTKDSLNKYKYTFTVKNCPYQEYCYVSGEWVK